METLTQPERSIKKAEEVLTTRDEIETAIYTALDNGVINIEMVDGDSAQKPDVYVLVQAKEEDLVLGEGSELSPDGSGYFAAHEFAWARKEMLVEEAKAVRERVTASVFTEQGPWYAQDPDILRHIDSAGPIRQILEFEVGNERLEVLNLSRDHDLSEDQVEEMRHTIDAFANTNGLGSLVHLRGIAIMPHETISTEDDEAVGLHKNSNNIILLSDRLLTPDLLKNRDYKTKEKLSPLESTLAHELGHSAQMYSWHVFDTALGWADSRYKTVDDYGNVVQGIREFRGKPASKQTVFEGTGSKTVDAESHFGEEVLRQAKPNTDYAGTSGAEDFAEAMVAYTFDGRNTELIDPIRRNAISNTLHRRAEEDTMMGPFKTLVHEADLNAYVKKEPNIQPSTLAIQVNAIVLPVEANDFEYRKIVNDYGYEEEVPLDKW